LSGDNVTLRIKAGTQSGSRHRVKGRGVETTKHHGDLIVTVNVVVPTSLTENERQAIENLASISKINPRDNTNNS
jgi:molecular chaperone DnaJ